MAIKYQISNDGYASIPEIKPRKSSLLRNICLNISMEITIWWPLKFAKFSDCFSSLRILNSPLYYRA